MVDPTSAAGDVRTDRPNVHRSGTEGIRPWQQCVKCAARSPSWGMSVSHSHRRTKRRWNPNIQRVRALVDGSPKRVNVCTGCIKAGKIVKAG